MQDRVTSDVNQLLQNDVVLLPGLEDYMPVELVMRHRHANLEDVNVPLVVCPAPSRRADTMIQNCMAIAGMKKARKTSA